jgi:hypothetical protein
MDICKFYEERGGTAASPISRTLPLRIQDVVRAKRVNLTTGGGTGG